MSGLDDLYGPANVAKLVRAYEAALRAVSAGRPHPVPDRSVRLLISETILSAAARGEFEPERLEAEAVRAAGCG